MSLALISKTDFVGFINIDFTGISDAAFTVYADQLDERMITRLFGKDMYDDIVANPATTANAYLITNFLGKMQVGYFYYYYTADRESFSTTIGEFEATAENAEKNGVSRNEKMIKQYNVGVYWYAEAYDYIQDNLTDYPLYDETKAEYYINNFDI